MAHHQATSSVIGGTTTSYLDIPFDLNKIFSLTYEFQPLKEVLEHIYGQLKQNKDGVASLDERCIDRFAHIER